MKLTYDDAIAVLDLGDDENRFSPDFLEEINGVLDDVVMLGAMAPFEGINVGIDRRSPVSWSLSQRHGTFPWTGSLRAVSYTPGEPAPDAGTRFLDLLREIGMRYE